jgi:hypothetical protein
MPVDEAARTLGTSSRTIYRRIKRKMLDTREMDGRTVVAVEPPDDRDTPEQVVRRLSDITSAELTMRHMDDATRHEIRVAYRDSLRQARAVVCGLTLAITAAIAVLGWGGLAFHQGALNHLEAIHELKTTHAVAVDRLKSENRRLSDSAVSQAVEVRRSQEAANAAVSRAVVEAENLACALERCKASTVLAWSE